MVVSKRRECKALCEKDRRNKIASQISLIAKVVPQDLLPPGFSQKDVLVAAYKFILNATSSATASCSKSGQVDEQHIDESACLKQLPTSATHVTYVITSASKPVLHDQYAQTDSFESGLVSSCPAQPNYVIMVQPTVLVDSSSKKRKIEARPQSTYPLLPKPSSSSVLDGGDILSQAAAAILSENQEIQTDPWPVPSEVTSTYSQTEEKRTSTQNTSCQTMAVNISENFQDIVDMVEEANQRQADSQLANRQKQPSGTGLRVENLLAPSYDRHSQQHSDAHSNSQRSALWSQYPNFTVSSFNTQAEQTTTSGTSNDSSAISAHSAAVRSNTSNVHQSSNRFTVDFSVAGVLRSDDASTSQIDQRSKLSHFANNAEQRQSASTSQQRSSHSSHTSHTQKQPAKRQTTQNRRQTSEKSSTTSASTSNSTCPQPSTSFIQPAYYPATPHHTSLDQTSERVDLSEDIFDYSAPTMDGNNWWYQRPAQAAQFWTNNSNSGYAYGSANANISWCPAPTQNPVMTSSSTSSQQQQRQTSNNSSGGRDKTQAGFHIANMLPEISPMHHAQQQQQQPDSRESSRQEDSSRRHAQQPHTSHQYWSADYALHSFSRPSYEMTSTNPYYRDPSIDDRTNFMPRFNL